MVNEDSGPTKPHRKWKYVTMRLRFDESHVTHASWTFSNGSCASSGVAGVAFDATGTGASLTPDEFDCAAGQGTTFPMPLDTYTFTVSAINSDGAALGTPGHISGVKVQVGNVTTEAGATVLSIP